MSPNPLSHHSRALLSHFALEEKHKLRNQQRGTAGFTHWEHSAGSRVLQNIYLSCTLYRRSLKTAESLDLIGWLCINIRCSARREKSLIGRHYCKWTLWECLCLMIDWLVELTLSTFFFDFRLAILAHSDLPAALWKWYHFSRCDHETYLRHDIRNSQSVSQSLIHSFFDYLIDCSADWLMTGGLIDWWLAGWLNDQLIDLWELFGTLYA